VRLPRGAQGSRSAAGGPARGAAQALGCWPLPLPSAAAARCTLERIDRHASCRCHPTRSKPQHRRRIRTLASAAAAAGRAALQVKRRRPRHCQLERRRPNGRQPRAACAAAARRAAPRCSFATSSSRARCPAMLRGPLRC
jgi:hypothetical protein